MKPLFEQVLIKVEKEEKEKKSETGLFYPNEDKGYTVGIVMAVGFEVSESFSQEVKFGSTKVIHREPNPISIKRNGDEYQLVHQKNILSVE